jgi:hypothetical protein
MSNACEGRRYHIVPQRQAGRMTPPCRFGAAPPLQALPDAECDPEREPTISRA